MKSSTMAHKRSAIYGLKQAGRIWNQKLDSELKIYGLQYHKGNFEIIIAIYVDDFLILYKDKNHLDHLKLFLNKKFNMKNLGEAKHCVGLNITQTNEYIDLDQCNFIHEITMRFGMEDCKPADNPCDTNQRLSIKDVNEENSLVGKIPYQEAVGSLLFIAQATRPGIAYAVNLVSRFNNQHSAIHWNAVKRIIRYLKATMDLKLRFLKNDKKGIYGYCDADWATDADERKSCSGYIFKYGSAAISWCSKKQTIVALSSTEAEYISLSSITKEAVWLKQLADELNINNKRAIIINCDNQSAIKLAENCGYRPRTKHIDIRHHHIREKIADGTIFIKYVCTKENVADSLTKPVTKEKHSFCAQQSGITL